MHNLRWLGLTLLLLHATAEAHLFKVFAYAEGNTIHGSVYFAGGNAVENAEITVKGKASDKPVSLTSNRKGEFQYSATTPDDYLIQANTGDGHQAEWLIKAEAFSPTATTANPTTPASSDSHSKRFEKSDQQLASLVEQAVAKQIGPLRESLQRNHDRARFSDILGGIGFIFGIAGIALWWRSKQANR
ncbi:carboxypeptidase-like regulatory domain-containing protein [Sedimenticola selenatireducens]|uniref:Carboxypeptidase regulatory-like domain-containing protein n=1 Tax=Sedimenticola selenatireducens TaxID=191960 RepID=A0A558DW60_9GAMM|nr:carboxypeptidase-like regulatory domain-containing protein [Sedimenticola selenatireducens]TVO77848.1 carboxypeptidase regulatory-like domain-containing protein [Sedimenticola selenatireducens]TVT65153.1 MAG: carboxypeptidase regulatory-like domain-containing protein [Sedimenticola selenatireducens]